MTAHRGPAEKQGDVVQVAGHQGLAALSLEGLSLLRDFGAELSVPVGRVGAAAHFVSVRVPTLGAYVVNKAITFPRRPAEQREGLSPKRSKDIL